MGGADTFLLLVVAPILSIMAWRRSHAAMDELTRLRQRVTELESKLAAAPPPVQVAVAEAPEPQPHATDEADIIARVQRYRQKPPLAAEKPLPGSLPRHWWLKRALTPFRISPFAV